MTHDEYPVCLSAKDTMRMMGWSRSMVYKLLNCSETGAFSIGGRKFFHRDRLMKWIAEQGKNQENEGSETHE